MRKNFLLTGEAGIGKTTLLKELIKSLKNTGGFWTSEIRKGGERIGFEIITLDGKRGILAHKDFKSLFRLGKYGINLKDLEAIGVKSIEDALEDKNIDIIVIDEIGKMELFSEKFKEVVMRALNSFKEVVGVLHRGNIQFLNDIRKRKDTEIFEVTHENRERILAQIKSMLNCISP